MADEEFEMYFARAKIEENWTNQGLPQRRCSLPVLATSDVMESRYRRGSSVKKNRKKSVPYGPHEYTHAFPSPILEVTSPNLEMSQEENLMGEIPTGSGSERKRSIEPTLFVYPSLDETEEVAATDQDAQEQNNGRFSAVDADLCVIRNFKSSPKGIVNRGDSIKQTRRASTATCCMTDSRPPIRRSGVICPPELSSLDLCSTLIRHNSDLNKAPPGGQEGINDPADFSKKVIIIGEKGVGKTSLMRQLMTSNYMGPLDSPQEMVSSCVNLAVTLDGEETSIELHKFCAKQELMLNMIKSPLKQSYHLDPVPTTLVKECMDIFFNPITRRNAEFPYRKCRHFEFPNPKTGCLPQPVSAYLVVFAVDSKSSYEGARALLERYSSTEPHVAMILVANKTDLARSRLVSVQDAKSLCRRLHAKYIELSVTLNHNVDNLLVGTVRQISFNPVRQVAREVRSNPAREHKLACLPLPKGLTKRLSLKGNVHDCENLSVL